MVKLAGLLREVLVACGAVGVAWQTYCLLRHLAGGGGKFVRRGSLLAGPGHLARSRSESAEGALLDGGGVSPHIDTGGQSEQWLNGLLERLWPKINVFIEKTLRESVQPSIQAALPALLRGTHFSNINMGGKSMTFESMRTSLTTRQTADGPRVGIKIVVDVSYKGDAQIYLTILGTSVGVSDITLTGSLVIVIPELTDSPPFIEGLSMYFPNKPLINMNRCGVANVADWDQVRGKVDDVILEQFSNQLVLPNRLAIVLEKGKGVFRYKRPRPAGLLRLTVVEARRLKAADASWTSMGELVTSDPFVRWCLGAQTNRTPVVEKSLNPKWVKESTFDILVEVADEQYLLLDVWDKDKIRANDFLGEAKVSVETLQKERDVWLDLQDGLGKDIPTSCVSLGSQIRIQAEWRDLRLDSEMANSIPQKPKDLTCLLFVGVYSAAGLSRVSEEGEHWLEICVEGQEFKTGRVKRSDDEKDEEDQKQETVRKINLLHNDIKADAETIADILNVPLESVERQVRGGGGKLDASAGLIEVVWEEGFVALLRDPRAASVALALRTNTTPAGAVMRDDGSRVLGKPIDYGVASLLALPSNTLNRVTMPLEGTRASLTLQMELRVLNPVDGIWWDDEY